FVGGLVGSLSIGFFANPAFFEGAFDAGIFYDGGASLLGEQALANLVTIIYSFVVTFLIIKALAVTVGVRVSDDDETTGLDAVEHGETAYHTGDVSMGRA
ncbi:MAG: ammonium transporter, partial [Ilumatobacteraceae bacterium]